MSIIWRWHFGGKRLSSLATRRKKDLRHDLQYSFCPEISLREWRRRWSRGAVVERDGGERADLRKPWHVMMIERNTNFLRIKVKFQQLSRMHEMETHYWDTLSMRCKTILCWLLVPGPVLRPHKFCYGGTYFVTTKSMNTNMSGETIPPPRDRVAICVLGKENLCYTPICQSIYCLSHEFMPHGVPTCPPTLFDQSESDPH